MDLKSIDSSILHNKPTLSTRTSPSIGSLIKTPLILIMSQIEYVRQPLIEGIQIPASRCPCVYGPPLIPPLIAPSLACTPGAQTCTLQSTLWSLAVPCSDQSVAGRNRSGSWDRWRDRRGSVLLLNIYYRGSVAEEGGEGCNHPGGISAGHDTYWWRRGRCWHLLLEE